MIWPFTLCALILGMGIFWSLPLNSAEVLKKEEIEYFQIRKIKFENHSYIHLRNTWTGADSHVWHDPSCEACVKMIKEIQGKK